MCRHAIKNHLIYISILWNIYFESIKVYNLYFQPILRPVIYISNQSWGHTIIYFESIKVYNLYFQPILSHTIIYFESVKVYNLYFQPILRPIIYIFSQPWGHTIIYFESVKVYNLYFQPILRPIIYIFSQSYVTQLYISNPQKSDSHYCVSNYIYWTNKGRKGYNTEQSNGICIMVSYVGPWGTYIVLIYSAIMVSKTS
jgi:hypothetical protein